MQFRVTAFARQTRSPLLAAVVFMAAMATGCVGSGEASPEPTPEPTPEPSSTTCVPGASDFCACPGGEVGVQECADDGTYGACECPTGEPEPTPTPEPTPEPTPTPEPGAEPSTTPPSCVPGATDFCACPGGQAGVQTCLEDGTYDACQCAALEPVDAGPAIPDGGVIVVDAGTVDGGVVVVDAGASPTDGGTPTGPVGGAGGPCYPNDTCDTGAICLAGECVAVDDGEEGGHCFANDTCLAGNTCVDGRCELLTCVGDVVIETPADYESIRSCGRLEGNLTIRMVVDVPSIDNAVRALREVAGDVRVERVRFAALEFAHLRHVGGNLVFSPNPSSTLDMLETLHLPHLKEVGGSFQVGDAANLQTLSSPVLERVDTHLKLERLFVLSVANLPLLTSVGGNALFHLLPELPELPGANGVDVYGSLSVTGMPIQQVTYLPRTTLLLSSTQIVSLNLDACDAYDVRLTGNDLLTDVNVRYTATARDDVRLTVQSSEVLTSIDVETTVGLRTTVNNAPLLTSLSRVHGGTDILSLQSVGLGAVHMVADIADLTIRDSQTTTIFVDATGLFRADLSNLTQLDSLALGTAPSEVDLKLNATSLPSLVAESLGAAVVDVDNAPHLVDVDLAAGGSLQVKLVRPGPEAALAFAAVEGLDVELEPDHFQVDWGATSLVAQAGCVASLTSRAPMRIDSIAIANTGDCESEIDSLRGDVMHMTTAGASVVRLANAAYESMHFGGDSVGLSTRSAEANDLELEATTVVGHALRAGSVFTKATYRGPLDYIDFTTTSSSSSYYSDYCKRGSSSPTCTIDELHLYGGHPGWSPFASNRTYGVQDVYLHMPMDGRKLPTFLQPSNPTLHGLHNLVSSELLTDLTALTLVPGETLTNATGSFRMPVELFEASTFVDASVELVGALTPPAETLADRQDVLDALPAEWDVTEFLGDHVLEPSDSLLSLTLDPSDPTPWVVYIPASRTKPFTVNPPDANVGFFFAATDERVHLKRDSGNYSRLKYYQSEDGVSLTGTMNNLVSVVDNSREFGFAGSYVYALEKLWLPNQVDGAIRTIRADVLEEFSAPNHAYGDVKLDRALISRLRLPYMFEGELIAINMPNLTRIDAMPLFFFPDRYEVQSNPQLAYIGHLPLRAAQYYGFYIRSNAQLPQCLAWHRWSTHYTSYSGDYVSNNRSGCTCDPALDFEVAYERDGNDFYFVDAGPAPLVPYDGPLPDESDAGVQVDGGIGIDGGVVDVDAGSGIVYDAGQAFIPQSPWPPPGPFEGDDLSWYDPDFDDVPVTCN